MLPFHYSEDAMALDPKMVPSPLAFRDQVTERAAQPNAGMLGGPSIETPQAPTMAPRLNFLESVQSRADQQLGAIQAEQAARAVEAPVPAAPALGSQAAGLGFTQDRYAPAPRTSLGEVKSTDLAHTAAAKKLLLGGKEEADRMLMGNRNGNEWSDQEVQRDLQSMPLEELRLKYGDEVADNRHRLYSEQARTREDQINASREYSGNDILPDLAVSAAQGGVGLATSAAALAGGLVSDDLGVALSGFQQDSSEWFDSLKSGQTNMRNTLGRAADSVDSSDNQIQYERDVAGGDSEFMAGLKRLGRDVLDTTGNIISDPNRLADSSVQVVGQLAVTGGIGALVSRAALPVVGVAGAAKLAQYAVTALTGAATGGDAYSGAVNDVLSRSEGQLRAESPEYNKLRESGLSHEDALVELAHEAGMWAAGIATPVGLVGGKLMSRFEANPVGSRLQTGFSRAGAVTGEGLQEVAEEGSSALGGNIGIQQAGVDPNQDLLEGVGSAAAEGLVGGVGGAGVLQGPGGAVRGAVGLVQGAANGASSLGSKISDITGRTERKADAAVQKINEASPNMGQAISDATTKIFEENEGSDAVPSFDPIVMDRNVKRIFSFTPEEVVPLSDEAADVLWPFQEGNQEANAAAERDKLGGMVRLAKAVANKTLSEESRPAAIAYLQSELGFLREQMKEGLHPIMKQALEGQNVPEKAISDALNAVANLSEMKGILNHKLTKQEAVNIVEASRNPAQAAVMLNRLDPALLEGVDIPSLVQGDNLSPEDGKELELAGNMTSHIQDFNTAFSEIPSMTEKQRRTQNHFIEGAPGNTNSVGLKNFVRNIQTNLRTGNLEKAQRDMARFAVFRKGNRDKLGILNKLQESQKKGSEKYQALTDVGLKEYTAFYDPENPNSATHVRIANTEMKLIDSVYDDLKRLYPEAVNQAEWKLSDFAVGGRGQRFSTSERAQAQPARSPEPAPVRDVTAPVVSRDDPKRGQMAVRGKTPQLPTFDGFKVRRQANPVKIPSRSGRARNYEEHDKIKASMANKIIGNAIPRSHLADAIKAYGANGNPSTFSNEDVVWIGTEMGGLKERGRSLPSFPMQAVNKAIAAGATLVVDAKKTRENKGSQVARDLVEHLLDMGYTEYGDGIFVPVVSVGGQVQSLAPQKAVEETKPAEKPVEKPVEAKAPVPEKAKGALATPINSVRKSVLMKIAQGAKKNGKIDVQQFTRDELKYARDELGAKFTRLYLNVPERIEAYAYDQYGDMPLEQVIEQAVEAVQKTPEQKVTPKMVEAVAEEVVEETTETVEPVMVAETEEDLKAQKEAALRLLVPESSISARFFSAYDVRKGANAILDNPTVPLKALVQGHLEKEQESNTAGQEYWESVFASVVPTIVTELNNNLNKTLNHNKGYQKRLLENSSQEFISKADNRHFSFIQKNENGSYSYIPRVAEIAALAVVEWIQTENPPIKDRIEASDAAAVFGVEDTKLVTQEMISAMELGTYHQAGTDRLKSILEKMMGVVPKGTQTQSEAGGLLLGLASEIMDVVTTTKTFIPKNKDAVPIENKTQETGGKAKFLSYVRTSVTVSKQDTHTEAETESALTDGKDLAPAKLNESQIPYNVYVIEDENIIGNAEKNILSWKALMNGSPTALELLVPTSEKSFFVGEPPLKRDNLTQLRGSQPLTKAQKESNDIEENRQYFLNVPMVNIFSAFGPKISKLIMGFDYEAEAHEKALKAGNVSPYAFNNRHLASIQGRNTSINLGQETAIEMIKAGWNYASANGLNLEEVPFYFKKDITVVGRQQEHGTGPVADKWVRQMMTPTQSVMDLSDPESVATGQFWMGIAQALGKKTEQISRADLVRDTQDLLSRENQSEVSQKLNNIMDVIEEVLTSPNEELNGNLSKEQNTRLMDNLFSGSEGFKSIFPGQPAKGLDALIHVVRLRLASPEERAEFQTSIAFEADGKTNGPANAMENFDDADTISLDYIRKMEAVGSFLNRMSSLNSLYIMGTALQQKHLDLYGIGAASFQAMLMDTMPALKSQPRVQKTFDDLLSLMNMTGNLLYDKATGELTVFRDQLKNPLTVSTYGSGIDGISGKLAHALLNAFSEKLSVRAREDNSSKGLTSMPEYQQLMQLVNRKAFYSKRQDKWFDLNSEAATKLTMDTDMTPETFALSGSQQKALIQNITSLMTNSLNESINGVIGNARTTLAAFQKATVVQGQLLADAFNREVDLVKNARVAEGKMKSSDILSKKDYEAILKKVGPIGAVIKMPTQIADITMSERMDFDNKNPNHIARSGSEKIRSNLQLIGPSNAGVKVAPYMTIMTGDGQMILKLSNELGSEGRVLFVYDGVEMALGKMDEYGLAANKAVHDTWQDDYTKYMVKSFEETLTKFDWDNLTDETKKQLNTQFDKNGWMNAGDNLFEGSVYKDVLQSVLSELRKKSFTIQARKFAVNSISRSVDQMAGVEKPYHNGKAEATYADLQALGYEVSAPLDQSLTQADLITYLNHIMAGKLKELEAAYEKSQNEKPVRAELDTSGDLNTILKEGVKGLREDSKLKIFSGKVTSVYNLVGRIGTRDQNAVLREATKKLRKEGYYIHFGDSAGLTQKRNLMNPDLIFREPVDQAQIDLNSKNIYVASGTLESLTHEMVHAAVSDNLLMGLMEPSLTTEAVVAAVNRLKLVTQEFMGLSMEGMSEAQRMAYTNARLTMLDMGYELQPDGMTPQAWFNVINEFLAWNLSNQDLIEMTKRVRVSNPLAQVAKKAINAMLRLLGLKDYADSMFVNTRFNAKILMDAPVAREPKLPVSALLNHSTIPTDDRLTHLNDKLEKIISAHLTDTDGNPRTTIDVVSASKVANLYRSAGFKMNPQEAHLFKMMQVAFNSTLELDSGVRRRLSEMYRKALENLTVDSLMDDPEANDPNDRVLAQDKYNVLTGSTRAWQDDRNRNYLMSGFLAASQIDPALRRYLAELEANEKREDRHAADNFFDWIGEGAFDYMSDSLNRMLWKGYQDKSVQKVMDTMLGQISVIEDDMREDIEKASERFDTRINDYLVEKTQNGLDKVLDRLEKLERDPNTSKSIQIGAFITRMIGSVASKNHGLNMADYITHSLNGKWVWTPIREFFGELRGTTGDNEKIHALVNRVRSLVSQSRQQYRDAIPHTIMQKFSRRLTSKEWSDMSKGLAKVDIGNLMNSYNAKQIESFYNDPNAITTELTKLSKELDSYTSKSKSMIRKADALANFMITGKVNTTNLLTNAYAIANLLGEPNSSGSEIAAPEMIQAIDNIVALKALMILPQKDKEFIREMMEKESEGMQFVLQLSNMMDQAEREKSINKRAIFNQIKGKIDTITIDSGSVVIAPKSDAKRLGDLSYKIIGDYNGDAEGGDMKYYYSPVNGQSAYHQGAMQTVQQTMYGVDVNTGFTIHGSGGIVLAGKEAQSYNASMRTTQRDGRREGEYYKPIFDENGEVFAYERIIAPEHLARLNQDNNMTLRLGAWRGRQEEEKLSTVYNRQLVDALKEIQDKDAFKGRDFINMADSNQRDRVHDHIWKNIPDDMKAYIEEVFGKNNFPVRRDMLNDALGYPGASIGDMFTGKTRMPKIVQDTIKNAAKMVFGDKAFQFLTTAERGLQTVVTAAKVTIVIKSIVVPVSNIVSNFYQLMMNGVPLSYMGKPLAAKIKETNAYLANRARQAEIQTEMAAYAKRPMILHRLQAEHEAIDAENQKMSIWPLIERGEFNTIADSLSEADRVVNFSQFFERVEQEVDKLPAGVKDAAQYAYVSRNTSLFKLLNRSTQYGDFLSKALLYDHMIKNQGKSVEDTYAIVRNEFVNYNLLPGRNRTFLESVGLIWFWNFKIRSVKVAIRLMRDNPLKALIWSMVPSSWVPLPGTDDSVLTDNLVTKAMDGTLDNSTGPGMIRLLWEGNPWVRLAS